MSKQAETDHPVHDLIASRWSPYGFADKPISDDHLKSLFEAARWAASSYNEQPWRYIVAKREQTKEFETLLSCLVEANQQWAKDASALALGIVSLRFQRNGKPNKAAHHDLGLASANLTFEATARGIYVHQMIGIVPDKARATYQIPEEYEPYTALAIGYNKPADQMEPPLKERDENPRSRRPLSEFVFDGQWNQPAEFSE